MESENKQPAVLTRFPLILIFYFTPKLSDFRFGQRCTLKGINAEERVSL